MQATPYFSRVGKRDFPGKLRLLVALVAAALSVAAPAAAPPFADTNRVLVSDVIIQRSRRVAVEHIKEQLKTRVGKEFNETQLLEDVRALFATKQFANVWADTQEDGPHRIKVFIYIRDLGPMVQKVAYKGNIHFSAAELEDFGAELSICRHVRQGMPLTPVENKMACSGWDRRTGHFR